MFFGRKKRMEQEELQVYWLTMCEKNVDQEVNYMIERVCSE